MLPVRVGVARRGGGLAGQGVRGGPVREEDVSRHEGGDRDGGWRGRMTIAYIRGDVK